MTQLKITLPEEVTTQALSVLKELKSRGAMISVEDLFIDALRSLESAYWDKQLDRWTPDEYLLILASKNPEAKVFLIQQAKRALDLLKKGEPVQRERKKPGPKQTLDPPLLEDL